MYHPKKLDKFQEFKELEGNASFQNAFELACQNF